MFKVVSCSDPPITAWPALIHAEQGAKVMTQKSTEPKIGQKMPHGTVYAGISPDTGTALYAWAVDAVPMTFNEAREFAEKCNIGAPAGLDENGKRNVWRVPTKNELKVLFNNRAKIGGFIESDHALSSYWSSSSNYKWDAWSQRFSDGDQFALTPKGNHLSVRFVRTEGPRP
jgi:hypothetical protein